MRRVFADNLPRKVHRGRECIDWNKCIGMDVRFICGCVEGFVKIIDYNKKTCRLTIERNGEKFTITGTHFLDGKLSNFIGLKTTTYKYKIGKVVNGLEILEHIRHGNGKYKAKGYKYKCTKDNYIGIILESSLLDGVGCPVCSNNLVVMGINDIGTTNPEIAPFFVNEEDLYKYSIGTKVQIQAKCIYCGYQKKIQPILLKNNIFKCPKCGDGTSYPEKFMFSALEQSGVDFVTQKRFKWSKRRVYDFYIPKTQCIIETHGLQHYKETGGSWMLLPHQVETDKIKRNLALENGLQKYIIIDCRESDMEWIKVQIKNSELSLMYNLDNVDWAKCHEYACCSNVKNVCDLWNSGVHSSIEISKILKMSRSTVLNYIEKGLILHWFN